MRFAHPNHPRASVRRRTLGWLVGPGCAAVLLAAMGISHLNFPEPADAAPYHAALLEIEAGLPLEFGPWEGQPIELPTAAVQLLKPNVLLGRAFVDTERRRAGQFLLAQCRDARDLSGHWPPNCYKTSGYTQTGRVERTWTVDGVELPGVEYTFVRETANERSAMVVANFLILPTVGYVRSMDDVYEAGSDYSRRYLGAAQVQVVTSAGLPPDARDAIFNELVSAHLPLIRAVADPDRAATLAP